ncbi:hypothetical protein [Aquimarina rubra]|uniref:Lipoprotein n=1 Tax=Aquimarina rubra TaxID=1920033 RepID=A0ABW5LKK7_9FLAO
MTNYFKIKITSVLSLIFISLTTLFLSSCENEALNSFDETKEIETGINIKSLTVSENGEVLPFSMDLMAGQHHLAGTVEVTADETNLYVTYKTNCSQEDETESRLNTSTNTGSWTLKATHLYVGNCEDLPTTKKGNPKIGKFPYKTEHGDGVSEFTYTIPLADIGTCFCLAAHAEVDCGDCEDEDNDDDTDDEDTKTTKSDNDDYCGEETAWAAGNDFPGNSWAMFTEFCIEDDQDDEDS